MNTPVSLEQKNVARLWVALDNPEETTFMKGIVIVGIVLIVLGALGLAYQGFTYTSETEVADIGPVEVSAEETKTIPLPPILGVLSLVGGIILVVVGSRR